MFVAMKTLGCRREFRSSFDAVFFRPGRERQMFCSRSKRWNCGEAVCGGYEEIISSLRITKTAKLRRRKFSHAWLSPGKFIRSDSMPRERKNFIFPSANLYLQTNDFILQVALNYISLDWNHMQRCPYLHEMKERLLGAQRGDTLAMESFDRERDNLLEHPSRPGSNQVGKVATVVKVRVSSFDTPQKIQVIQSF